MTNQFPRLLVATEFPPNASGGGPAVVRQMLKDWPVEKLYWWSVMPDSDAKFERATANQFNVGVPPKMYPRSRLPRLKAQLMDRFWVPFASLHLARTIHKVQPETIWAIPHQWSIPPLAKVLCQCAAPYNVSIHDFPDAHHPERVIGKIAKRLTIETNELYRLASTSDVISREMAGDMEECTGRTANQIVHAGLEPEDFRYLDTKRVMPKPNIKIAYAGTVVAEESFILFVKSLSRIRERLRRPLELHFFGAHSYRDSNWFDDRWMREHGDFSATRLSEALREFDWGFAPMELVDTNPRYNRFSLPTKVVSYLAAGLGIITLAHSTATVSHLARRYSFGLRITETELEEMDAILERGLGESQVWDRYAPAIIRCAGTEFDGAETRAQVRVRFAAAAKSYIS